MRGPLLFLLVAAVLGGCLGTGPEAQPPSVAAPASDEAPPRDEPTPEAESATAPAPSAPEGVPPGEAHAEGKATLIAHPAVLPTDRLGLRFAVPEGYARAVVTLTWSATLPSQDRLALRIHEEGVLDAEGRVVLTGGAPLVQVLSGPSPIVWEATAADLPAGTYDAHVYPADEATPVVEQPFAIHVAWS